MDRFFQFAKAFLKLLPQNRKNTDVPDVEESDVVPQNEYSVRNIIATDHSGFSNVTALR